jgi:hypothetical protein
MVSKMPPAQSRDCHHGTAGLKPLQDDVKKLNEEFRRRRRPVVQAISENVLGKERIGSSQTGFDRARLDHAEISKWRDPSRRIPVKVLPCGFSRPAVNRFYDVRLRT